MTPEQKRKRLEKRLAAAEAIAERLRRELAKVTPRPLYFHIPVIPEA